MRKTLTLLALALAAAAGFAVAYGPGDAVAWVTTNPHPDKVTICHAAGQAGTTKFVTLTIGYEAVYGPGGHFNEDGTPQAGHEQDYFGACQTDTTTTETTTTETTTGTTTTEPTTTETTTTTEPPGPPCPNGEPPIHGQNENPGNDACDPCAPPVNVEKCPPPSTTTTASTTTETTTTTEPPSTTTTAEPTTTTETTTPAPSKPVPPKVHPKPKPPKQAKPKPPPVCPPGKTYTGPCAVQGSG
jgi:hypothetical protein